MTLETSKFISNFPKLSKLWPKPKRFSHHGLEKNFPSIRNTEKLVREDCLCNNFCSFFIVADFGQTFMFSWFWQ